MSDASNISAHDARRAARNIGALVIASILSKGLLFAWQIVLGGWLRPYDYGIYTTVVALFAVGMSIAGFGIGMIAIREVASAPEKIGQYATSMLFTQTVLATLAYIGIIGAALIAGYEREIVAFTAIAGISLLIDTFGNIANDLLLAQERMVTSSVMEIVQIIVRVSLAAWALWAGWGLLGVYGATLISSVVRSLVLWTLHIRQGLRLVFPLQRAITVPLMVNAAPLALSAFLSLAYQHADKLMTTGFIGAEDTGYLAPAFLFDFGITELLSTTLLVAIYPLMARAHSGTGDTFGFMVEKVSRVLLMVALPLALVITIFADDIIRLLYPPDYVPTIALLRLIIWYTFLTIIGNIFAKALLIQNRQRLTLLIRVVSLSLNIVLNIVLLWRFRDPRAAVVASIAAEALAFSWMALAFRTEGFAWSRVLPLNLRVLFLGGITASVMIVLGLVHSILGIGVGAVVYLVGVRYGGILADDDWDLLYRLLMAMPFGRFIARYWQRDVAINW